MPVAFYPTVYQDVPASQPHPPGTTYRVSVGWENWGGEKAEYVQKIQMAYDGNVTGRKVPSFPDDSDDFERVCVALEEVRKGNGKNGRGKIFPAGPWAQ